MTDLDRILEIIEKTKNTDHGQAVDEFDPLKKRLFLEFYQSIGMEYPDLLELGQKLQTKDDYVPKDFLNYGEEVISESFGKLVGKYRELVRSYTPFPYSSEESARLIRTSLSKSVEKYHRSSLVIHYTTKLEPDKNEFRDALAHSNFDIEHYGKLDIIGGTLALIKSNEYHVNFFELLRGNGDFLEFRIVFGVSDVQQKTKHTDDYVQKVKFDTRASELKYLDKTCVIPDESLEHYVCKLVFKNRKIPALEEDILAKTVKSQESQRAVQDAVNRVNKKVMSEFGLEKLLMLRAGKVRISNNYK